MNREKIEKALKQIDIALEALNSDNYPEFKADELDYNGYGITVMHEYGNTSKAYQLLDGISEELQDILDTAAQNNE